MGCCFSIKRQSSTSSDNAKQNKAPPPLAPPPLLEEETVKEVLSETPKPKPHQLPKIKNQDPKISTDNIYEKPIIVLDCKEISEQISTLTESVSSVPTVKRDNEEEDEDRQPSPVKYRNRAVSGELTREKMVVGKSPLRKPEFSPGRARVVTGRERPKLVADGQRSGTRSGSNRRSMFPANTKNVGARLNSSPKPSARRSGKSQGRVRSEVGEKKRKVEAGNETLENPLVSLECFIFL